MCNKRRLLFENNAGWLFNDKIILQSQRIFKSDHHKPMIALSSNNDKRLQTFDKITTYPYGMEQYI